MLTIVAHMFDFVKHKSDIYCITQLFLSSEFELIRIPLNFAH